jgi:hypothetical protein
MGRFKKMNCHKVKILLGQFLEGELSGSIKEKVETHLKTCTNCQREKELFSKTWQMLDSYVTPKLRNDFTTSLMERIHSEQTRIVKVVYRYPQFSLWFNPRRLVPALALLLIVVLTSFLLWRKPPSEERMAKITPSPSQEVIAPVTDEEIIRNLDFYESIELLQNLNLLSEMEIVKNLEELTS